jgi:Glycosyl hydrolases family 39
MFVLRFLQRLPLFMLLWLGGCLWPAAANAVVYGAGIGDDVADYVRGAWTQDQFQASLAKLRATGVSVARAGAEWDRTEPKPPVGGRYRYDWSYDDMVVGALANAHLRWDPILAYTPNWAQQHIKPAVYHGKGGSSFTSPLPPADNRVYAAYAAAFARRYGVDGSFWRTHPRLAQEPVKTFEIWNEPDCRWTWGPDVNLQDYVRLYSSAYRAIKRVDRHSMVITGGLAFTRSSLPRLLKAFKGVPIDGLGVHPYGPNATATIGVVRWTEAQMVAYGRRRTPLVVNEYGWNSLPHSWQSVPKRVLKRDVERSVIGLSKIGHVVAVIPFQWSDPNWGLNDGALAAGIKRARF